MCANAIGLKRGTLRYMRSVHARATLCTMHQRNLSVAQHEAAHVVVGVALGLRMRAAVLEPARPGFTQSGYAWFPTGARRKREALALMYAAGVAWDRAVGDRFTATDTRLVRAYVSGRHGVESCVRAAAAMLAGLGPAHARVTRALLERDLSGADITALARGERLTEQA